MAGSPAARLAADLAAVERQIRAALPRELADDVISVLVAAVTAAEGRRAAAAEVSRARSVRIAQGVRTAIGALAPLGRGMADRVAVIQARIRAKPELYGLHRVPSRRVIEREILAKDREGPETQSLSEPKGQKKAVIPSAMMTDTKPTHPWRRLGQFASTKPTT